LTSVPVRLVFFTSTLVTLLLAIWRLPICLTAYAAEADFGPHRLASQKVMAPLDSLRRVSSAHLPAHPSDPGEQTDEQHPAGQSADEHAAPATTITPSDPERQDE
jgi:hypothetical protein